MKKTRYADGCDDGVKLQRYERCGTGKHSMERALQLKPVFEQNHH